MQRILAWVSDGTMQGTKPFIDLTPDPIIFDPNCATPPDQNPVCSNDYFNGVANSEPRSLTVQGDWLYFSVNAQGLYYMENARDLYRTDGTAAGTQKLQSMGSHSIHNPARIFKWNEKLLVTGYDAERDRAQLWSIP
jgi:hypothetical protein